MKLTPAQKRGLYLLGTARGDHQPCPDCVDEKGLCRDCGYRLREFA